MLTFEIVMIWLVGVPVLTAVVLRLREVLARRRQHGPRTLWPGSNAARWPEARSKDYVEAGLVRAEEWANHG